MAEFYRFFGSAVGDTREYNQVEFAEVLSTVFLNGYLKGKGNEFVVSESTPQAMSVVVETGEAWINGYWYKNDAPITVPIDAADGSNPRRDLIVLKLDVLIGRLIEVTVLKGTAAAAPVLPSLTQTSQVWEIPLAEVLVGTGVVSIVNANITDLRVKAVLWDSPDLEALINTKEDIINLTTNRAVASDGSGALVASATTATELGHLSGVTSAIQTQLNGKQATITGGATTITSSNLTASRALASDGSGKVAVSATTATELGHLSGVTSAVQTQLNGKQATITGGATTITSSNLTASRALVSDGSGKVAVATTTSTELGHLSGVTSAVQTQLNAKAPLASPAFTSQATIDALRILVNDNATGTQVLRVWSGTLAQYNAIGSKRNDTLYFIV